MGKDLNGRELGVGLSQRKNGIYCARFTDKFGKRRSIYGNTLSEVKEKLLKTEYENKILNSCVKEELTLDEWFEQWFLLFKNDTRITTQYIYKTHYNSFISPVLGKYKLTDITQLQIRYVIKVLQDNGYAWETQSKVKRLLSEMYENAIASSVAVKNPARGIRIKRQDSVSEKRIVLSVEEQEAFLKEAQKSFFYNAYIVQLNTGIRAGELFALTEEDLDFESKCIKIERTLQQKWFDGQRQVAASINIGQNF